MVQKFSFCSKFYADVSQTFTFNTVLSIWKQSLFHKTWSWSYNLLFRWVLLYFTRNFSQRVSLLTSLMKQYILLRYITRYPLWRSNTRKYSLGESILLVKTEEYTMLYISDKFQGVWMTKFFHMSVFYRALKLTNLLISHLCIQTLCTCLSFRKTRRNRSMSTGRHRSWSSLELQRNGMYPISPPRSRSLTWLGRNRGFSQVCLQLMIEELLVCREES